MKHSILKSFAEYLHKKVQLKENYIPFYLNRVGPAEDARHFKYLAHQREKSYVS